MKLMIAVSNTEVAPRFDLTVEAVIAEVDSGAIVGEPRVLLISEPSGDELCALAVSEDVDVVICGGIDELHFEYLAWKDIEVIDGIVGPFREALEAFLDDQLPANSILPGALVG